VWRYRARAALRDVHRIARLISLPTFPSSSQSAPSRLGLRSIEDMNQAPSPRSGPADFDRFLRHGARYWAIAPKVYPRGVFKFRSIEEARHPVEHD
jgi:hypothetical protein